MIGVRQFLGAALLIVVVGMGSLPAQAAGIKQYHNAAVGYAFSYPATWKTQSGQGVDIAVFPSDNHAGVIALHLQKKLTSAQLAAAAQQSLTNFVKVQGTITCRTVMIGKTAGTKCSAKSKDSKGVLGIYDIAAVPHKGYLIFMIYGYDLNQSVTAADKAAIAAFEISITLL